MQWIRNKRLFFSCLYLGGLFLVAGTLYSALQSFSGTLFIFRGASERLVIRPGGEAFTLGAAHRNVPPDLLLLDDPRVAGALRHDQTYDAVVLPFFVRLDSATIRHTPPVVHQLEIEGPGDARRVTVTPGTTLDIGSAALEVAAIGPWAGLIRNAAGRPGAAIALGGVTDGAVQFLEPGQWVLPRPDLAIGFHWHADEAAAIASYADGLDALSAARWGARDGNAIQWLDNFVPGTGTVLRDGTRVAIAEDRREDGWILLRVTKGPDSRSVRVEANTGREGAPFLLEDPAATGRVLALHAWRDNQVIGRLITAGAVESRTLAAGESWALPPDGLPVQVRQVMGAAVAVPGDGLTAVYLRGGGRDFALHEGLLETVGDHRIRYRREQPPPEAAYTLSTLDAEGTVLETFTLGPGDRQRIGAWVFALAGENPYAPEGVALEAVRRPGGATQIAGIALLLAGSFGLVLARFRRPAAI